MNKYIYTAALLGAMTLASCQKDEAGIGFNSDPEAVKITATVGNSIFSRSNPTGDVAAQKTFNIGDQLSVSADAQTAAVYTFNGSKWTPETKTYLRWEQETMNFSASYPATAGTDAQNFVLPTDQSDPTKIAAADYMTAASVSKNKADGAVSLELSRKMARIIVKIESFNNQYTDEQKHVKTVSLCSYAIGYENGTVKPIRSAPVEITPYCGKETPVTGGYGAGTSFTALMLPDAELYDAYFIGLKDGEGNMLFVKGIPAHEAGKSYTYNVRVGKDKAEITGVTVEDWQSGDPIADGETEEVLPFGDTAFTAILKDSYGVQVNAKGEIDPKNPATKTALEAITELNINNKGISDIAGVEYMINLTKLECNRNSITSLDISKNTLLTYFDCYGNGLSSLDVSKNTALKTLCCDNNNLTSLDISNNTVLNLLECQKNKITALDVSHNKELTTLWCFVNQLTSLEISNNVKLEILECGLNQLTTLDFSKNENLQELSCYGNRYKTLDVTILPKLHRLACTGQTSDGKTPQQLTLTLTTAQSNLQYIKDKLDATVTTIIKD